MDPREALFAVLLIATAAGKFTTEPHAAVRPCRLVAVLLATAAADCWPAEEGFVPHRFAYCLFIPTLIDGAHQDVQCKKREARTIHDSAIANTITEHACDCVRPHHNIVLAGLKTLQRALSAAPFARSTLARTRCSKKALLHVTVAEDRAGGW